MQSVSRFVVVWTRRRARTVYTPSRNSNDLCMNAHAAPQMAEKLFKKSNPNIYNGNLEFWMTQLPPFLKTLSIIHLAIPGSHNTMTYTIKRGSDVGPDETTFVRLLGRFCGLISKPVIYNWAVTQNDDVIEQLNGGIRYIDLRLATKAKNNADDDETVYFLHGLYGCKVFEPLQQINQWLSLHPEEFLILDCQHFYAFTETTHRCFIDLLKRTYGKKLCPRTRDPAAINLGWLNAQEYQIFVVYRNDAARIERDLWPSGVWPTPWPNTVDPLKLVDFLDVRLRTRIPNIGFVSQCLLTPDAPYVLTHLCGNLRANLAKPCRNAALPWIREHRPGVTGLNVVIADFVSQDYFLFSRTVIQRNNELLRIPELAATHRTSVPKIER